MKRLLAVLTSFALLGPAWAADVKSVPEIKAEINPGGQKTPAAAPLPVDPGLAAANLGLIPSLIAPQAPAQVPQAAPAVTKTPQAGAKLSNEAPLKVGPSASPEAKAPDAGGVDKDVMAGQVQFDQAQTITANSPGLDPLPIGGNVFHVSGLAPGTERGTSVSIRGPPGVGDDGATITATFSQVLDHAVSGGRLSPKLREELLDAAYRDPLTGLHNRQFLDANLDAFAKRYRSLATFKLDSLKEINDSYDHETGNKFMRGVAAVSDIVVGPDGVVVRRSPTGFAVFLDAPASDARMAAEALRIAVSRKMGDPSRILPAAPETSPGGTISVGVSVLNSDVPAGESYRAALTRAEGARKFAQEQGGGDRVAYDDGDSKLMDRRTLEEAVSAFKRARKDGTAKRLEELDAKDLSQLMQERDSTMPKPAEVAGLMAQLEDPEVRRAAFIAVYRDRLSGLLNRRYLFDHLEGLLTGYTSYMALDLDKFGDINAALGEDKADLIIKELGALLLEGAHREGLPLHLSGEEFVVLGSQHLLDPKRLGESLRLKVRDELGKRVAEKYGILNPRTGEPYVITVSAGIAPIKHDSAAAEEQLELVTAMAESLLQRAKANGRDRVEIGAEGLTAMLARVVRVDETVRKVVDGLLKPAGRPAPGAAFFDNGFKSRAEVLDALKFNPASEPGTLLSDPGKGGSQTLLVSPAGKPRRVVKISDQEVISNETLLRGIVENFETFNRRISSPKSVAYKRVWPFSPVLVQEHIEDAHKGAMNSTNLPLSQKISLALLAGTFGVFGFNPGAFLDVNFSRSVIVDFEMSRGEFEVSKGPLPIGAGTFHPWVADNYLNEMEDYRLALKSWSETFAKRETQAELVRLMRRAAIPEARIQKDLKVFAGNLAILDQTLARDIATGNRDFRDSAKRAGLDEGQVQALSFVNKTAHLSPAGGIFRDLVRLLNGRASKVFALGPEEWKLFASARPDGLTQADRESALKAAYAGKAASPHRAVPYNAPAVRSALNQLDTMLKSRGLPLVADVKPIETSRGTMVHRRLDLKKLVEAPLLEAVEILYDKNVRTTDASANGKDLDSGYARITLEARSLSEGNRGVLERLPSRHPGVTVEETDDDGGRIYLRMPVDSRTTVAELKALASDIARAFHPQDASWIPSFTLAELAKSYGYTGAEAAALTPVDFIKEGYYYDARARRFFYSEEQSLKAAAAPRR